MSFKKKRRNVELGKVPAQGRGSTNETSMSYNLFDLVSLFKFSRRKGLERRVWSSNASHMRRICTLPLVSKYAFCSHCQAVRCAVGNSVVLGSDVGYSVPVPCSASRFYCSTEIGDFCAVFRPFLHIFQLCFSWKVPMLWIVYHWSVFNYKAKCSAWWHMDVEHQWYTGSASNKRTACGSLALEETVTMWLAFESYGLLTSHFPKWTSDFGYRCDVLHSASNQQSVHQWHDLHCYSIWFDVFSYPAWPSASWCCPFSARL